MENNTYNGWTNRETWALNLHLTNSEWIDNQMNRLAREDVSEKSTISKEDRYGFSIRDSATFSLAETIQNEVETWVEEFFSELKEGHSETVASLIQDVGSFWRVDYREIAQHYVDAQLEEVSQ